MLGCCWVLHKEGYGNLVASKAHSCKYVHIIVSLCLNSGCEIMKFQNKKPLCALNEKYDCRITFERTRPHTLSVRREYDGTLCLLFSVAWTTATLCSLKSSVFRCTSCKSSEPRNEFFFNFFFFFWWWGLGILTKAVMNTLYHCSNHSTGCQSNKE